MSLPVINTPTYELEVPSTKVKLKYRPFLVKEEKILLIAMEEEDQKHMVNAVRTIVDNCTFKTIKVNKMPMFDLEYVFLNIRAKSVGEVVSVKILCDDDKETYADVDIPLEEITVKFQKDHINLIDLTDDIKIERVLSKLNILDIRSPPKNDKKTNKVKFSLFLYEAINYSAFKLSLAQNLPLSINSKRKLFVKSI